MLALLLLAQVASATPAAPAPTSAPALGKASTAVSAKPKTLADLAQERKLAKAVGGGTLSVSGASGMPVVPPNTGAGGARDAAPDTGNARVRNAEADVKAARHAVDEEAARKGMTSEDTAAARRKLDEARRELNKEREAAAR
ncbi:MAG: hypothetical protein PT977_14525 [Acidobacteriota bacterium]|nr:hypothetical protein [Acidobacteriota bacterium]